MKLQMQALQKAGRLELALQIPNSPILPLLMEDPPYGYPDDVVQLVARSKAGFFKQWNYLPRGLVLPFGAASPKLVSLLERLGFSWMIAALQAPIVDGAYQSGPLMIWDASPSGKPVGTTVRVWDERQMKDRPLDNWLLEMGAETVHCILPQDATASAANLEPLGGLENSHVGGPGFVHVDRASCQKFCLECSAQDKRSVGSLQEFRASVCPAAGCRF